jgi:hypothetical protein
MTTVNRRIGRRLATSDGPQRWDATSANVSTECARDADVDSPVGQHVQVGRPGTQKIIVFHVKPNCFHRFPDTLTPDPPGPFKKVSQSHDCCKSQKTGKGRTSDGYHGPTIVCPHISGSVIILPIESGQRSPARQRPFCDMEKISSGARILNGDNSIRMKRFERFLSERSPKGDE